MGTSQSSKGSSGQSTLVPPWADDQPQLPIPLSQPGRFKGFRQSFGSFVKSRNNSDLKSALRHYSKTSTGGGGTVSRRMGSTTQAGARLYDLLSGRGSSAPAEAKINLSDLSGKPCDIAISILVNSIMPDGGDADRIRTAMNHALVEALDGVEIFDPSVITDDIIANTMICYLSESIFLQVTLDAGDAWKKADTYLDALNTEIALREFINVVVDKHMAPMFSSSVRAFSRLELIKIQKDVIEFVWKEWSTYS